MPFNVTKVTEVVEKIQKSVSSDFITLICQQFSGQIFTQLFVLIRMLPVINNH